MKIIEVTVYSPEVHHRIEALLEVLLAKKTEITDGFLQKIIASDDTYLFLAIDNNDAVLGMLTLAIYSSPSGTKSWIEDVAVHSAYQGQGLGRKLMQFAIQFAKQKETDMIMLTSNPHRIAANKLYQSLDFERKETNVYKLKVGE